MSLQRDNWVIGSGAWCADICYIKQWFSLSPQGCINLGHPISPRIPTACRLHPSTSSLPHLTPYGRGQNWSSEGREHALPPRGNTFSSIHARFLERKRAAESTKKLRNRQNYQFLINERETIQNHIQTTLLLVLLLCKVLHLGLVAQVQGFSSVGLSPTSHANLRLPNQSLLRSVIKLVGFKVSGRRRRILGYFHKLSFVCLQADICDISSFSMLSQILWRI